MRGSTERNQLLSWLIQAKTGANAIECNRAFSAHDASSAPIITALMMPTFVFTANAFHK
jgi:hypothetical protein